MNKFYLTCFIILSIAFKSFNQDIITKRNNEQIKADVIEVVEKDVIKYKLFENPEGPLYVIKISEVFMITYENGAKDIFEIQESQDNIEKVSPQNINSKSRFDRRGFIGFSLGGAIPTGNFASGDIETGYILNLFNFGFVFSEYYGMVIKLNGIAHLTSIEYDIDQSYNQIFSYSNLLSGLLISYPSKNINFDIRLMAGMLFAHIDNDNYTDNRQGYGVSTANGSGIRIHTGKTVSIIIEADYIYSRPKLLSENKANTPVHIRISSVTLAAGLVFRLK